MLTKDETLAYLHRIGIPEMQPPSKEYLFELHKAHVEKISWQTLDIFAGNPAPIDVSASVGLMLNQRSGYCFHLNGAFRELLRSLGYEASWHRAGVHFFGAEPQIDSYHVGLSVDLKNDNGDAEKWIIDVGLGDMPYEPIPLQVGEYKQGPLLYKVKESGIDPNGWRLEHDPLASYVGVDFAPEAVPSMDAFSSNHEFYSRSKDSPWIDTFLLRQRHAEGSNELRGCIWKKRTNEAVEKIEISSKSQWLEVLADIFGEPLVHYSDLEKDEIWKHVEKQHDDWKKAKNVHR